MDKIFCRTTRNQNSINLDKILVLIPILLWGIYIYGIRALTIVLTSTIIQVSLDLLFSKIQKIDFSIESILHGFLLGLLLPVGCSIWIPIICALLTSVLKAVYRAIKYHVANPLLVSLVIVYSLLNKYTANYIPANTYISGTMVNIPKTDFMPSILELNRGIYTKCSLFDIVIGNTIGTIGELSAVLLILASLYLILRKDISWYIPVVFVVTIAVLSYLFPTLDSMHEWEFMIMQIMGGTTLICANFIATEPNYQPINKTYRLIYAICCGALTILFRFVLTLNDGCFIAILICGFLYSLIEHFILPIIAKKKSGK